MHTFVRPEQKMFVMPFVERKCTIYVFLIYLFMHDKACASDRFVAIVVQGSCDATASCIFNDSSTRTKLAVT